MDFEFEKRWNKVIDRLETQFGTDLEIEGILFLIGVQELGQGTRRFKKDEKLNLMHIALCTVFAPYGYYEFSHYDADGWPHFETLKKLPFLSDKEQKQLLKRGIVDYFERENLIDPAQKSSDSAPPPQSA